MKNRHLIAALLALLPLSAAADSNLGAHGFVIWANGGISNYIGSTPNAKMAIGGGGALGFGYEWRNSAFLLQTGLAGKYAQSGLRINDGELPLPDQYDAQAVGQTFNYIYTWKNRKDRYTTITAQIPLLVGAHINRFYFLAGAKVNLNIINDYKASATISGVGRYKEFWDDLADMPNHGFFSNLDLSTDGRTLMKVNVAGSVELGAEIPLTGSARSETDNYFRIGVFADMNILDDRITKSGQPLLSTPKTYTGDITMQNGLKMVDYLSSSEASSPVRNLFAGLKLTFIISSGVKYGCVMCQSGYPTRRDRRRGNRVMIY